MISEQNIKIIQFRYVGVGSTEVTVTYNIPGVFENNIGLDWTHPLSSFSVISHLIFKFSSYERIEDNTTLEHFLLIIKLKHVN